MATKILQHGGGAKFPISFEPKLLDDRALFMDGYVVKGCIVVLNQTTHHQLNEWFLDHSSKITY